MNNSAPTLNEKTLTILFNLAPIKEQEFMICLANECTTLLKFYISTSKVNPYSALRFDHVKVIIDHYFKDLKEANVFEVLVTYHQPTKIISKNTHMFNHEFVRSLLNYIGIYDENVVNSVVSLAERYGNLFVRDVVKLSCTLNIHYTLYVKYGDESFCVSGVHKFDVPIIRLLVEPTYASRLGWFLNILANINKISLKLSAHYKKLSNSLYSYILYLVNTKHIIEQLAQILIDKIIEYLLNDKPGKIIVEYTDGKTSDQIVYEYRNSRIEELINIYSELTKIDGL